MPRIAGRNARLFVAVASGGSAEPIPFIKSFSIDSEAARYDVTALGDTGLSYVQGLADSKGSFSGFYDTSTAQLYTAAVDGIARKMYAYPDFTNTPGQYWYGTSFFSFSTEFSVDAAAPISGTWASSNGSLTKVG